MKSFSELLIYKIFEYTFVTFEYEQTICVIFISVGLWIMENPILINYYIYNISYFTPPPLIVDMDYGVFNVMLVWFFDQIRGTWKFFVAKD